MAHLESLVILDVAGKSGAALGFGFERSGLRAYATREPDDAFAMARTRVPHLVIVTVDGGVDDHNGKDELALIGRLREEPETRELPIVAVGEYGRRDQALRAGADEYVTRPAFIRDVLTLAKLAVAVRQDGDEAGVVGMLEDYGLYFLVRALAVAGRSCVLDLERGLRQGEVHFAQGAVVAARVGRMSGIAALQHLLLWGEAAMSLRFESPAGERKIAAHVDELLEQGAGFAREFEKLAGRVGGAQAVYAQEPLRAAESREHIPAEVMSLVKQYDGRKPLIDIVEDSPFKPFDTIKITYRLAELGAITRRPAPNEVTPLSAQLAVREWLLGADGREEAAPRGEARGVTEAGRRAAEAYAAHEAERATHGSPADDILNDAFPELAGDGDRLAAERLDADPLHPVLHAPDRAPELHAPESSHAAIITPEPAAPREEIYDDPTLPREGKRGPTARNKKRKTGRQTVPASPAATAQARSQPGGAGAGNGAAASSGSGKAGDAAAHAHASAPNAAATTPPARDAHALASGGQAAADAKESNGSGTSARAGVRDAAAKSAHGKDAHGKDAHGKDAHGKDAHGKDAHGKDAHGKDAHGKDAHGKDAHGKDAHGKDAHGKDAHGKASATPAQGAPRPGAAPVDSRLSPAASTGAPSKNIQAPARPASSAASGAAVGKLSPQAISRAHTKEPIFNDMEEEFFAREAELAPTHTADNFDDLEHPRPKLSPKRPWFTFRKK